MKRNAKLIYLDPAQLERDAEGDVLGALFREGWRCETTMIVDDPRVGGPRLALLMRPPEPSKPGRAGPQWLQLSIAAILLVLAIQTAITVYALAG